MSAGPAHASSDKGASGFAFTLRALRYRNYRLYFGGQLVSLIGSWMTDIATSWLVYRLTGSALLLGVVGFAGKFPAFLLAPVAGIFVDRWNKHRLILVTQSLQMLQSLSLAYLTFTGRINVPWLVALNVFEGFVNAFDMPARQAFLIEMVEKKEDLGNAIALNSSMVNAARLLGPSIGGILIAAAGEGWCFLIDGVSFLAVLGALAAMRVAARAPKPAHKEGALGELREGWRYVSGSRPIRSIILLLALVGLVGVPYTVLIPVFAGRILGGGPHTLGWLMTAAGGGALCGAVILASRKTVLGLGRWIPYAALLFGAALVGFSFSRTLWLSLPLVLLAGAGFMIQLASSNTIVQTITDDDKRGRVMSFFMMAFLGSAPFGSLFAGGLADRIGAPQTLRIGGVFCVLGGLWFLRELPQIREAIRPIYRRMGILPQLAAGVASAENLSVPPED